MLWLVLGALISPGYAWEDTKILHKAIPTHMKHSDLRFFASRSEVSLRGPARMDITVLAKHRDNMDVQVSWANAPNHELHEFDWIGVFDHAQLTEFHAPIKYRYVFPRGARPPYANNGTMDFHVWNLRSTYVIMYISGDIQFPIVVCQSRLLSFDDTLHPMAHHVALSPVHPDKMLVMWIQELPKQMSAADWKPRLRFGHSPDNLIHSVSAARDTYSREDFCDIGVSPASRQGWFEPGFFLTAEVPIMPGQTYYYASGDYNDKMLQVMNFTAPPAVGSGPTRLIMLADLGNAPDDGSGHHSWDFGGRGEIPSRNTTRLSKHLLDKHGAHAVVHVGDISYSVGYLSEWDEFQIQIEPVASRIPWMASIGNHEVGWSQSDPFDGMLETETDSGGECGVAFLKRFPYAMQTLPGNTPWREAQPWYSFKVGLVHFVMLSSEHDFRRRSPQWQWLIRDLQQVDRSLTPWLVVTSHRAMYIASDYDGDLSVAKLLRDNLESELLTYGVDFFLAGHHHSYQRLCKINGGQCVGDGQRGIHHFVMGMAGYDHSPVASGLNISEFTDDTHWGATYWEFNSTVASMSFIDGATEEVLDQITFHKPAAVQLV